MIRTHDLEWSAPDKRGHLTCRVVGADPLMPAPERAGYVAYFVGRVGNRWTTWTYRPVVAA